MSDPVIVNLRTQVGSIEENNIRRYAQQVETMRIVTEHGKILTEQSKLLKVHD